MESWACCLRVLELVGLDRKCIEQYLPHGVAKQFGINQDVPGDVARTNSTSKIVWRFYMRPVKMVNCIFRPDSLSHMYLLDTWSGGIIQLEHVVWVIMKLNILSTINQEHPKIKIPHLNMEIESLTHY